MAVAMAVAGVAVVMPTAALAELRTATTALQSSPSVTTAAFCHYVARPDAKLRGDVIEPGAVVAAGLRIAVVIVEPASAQSADRVERVGPVRLTQGGDDRGPHEAAATGGVGVSSSGGDVRAPVAMT
jgi:hypothetical protein